MNPWLFIGHKNKWLTGWDTQNSYFNVELLKAPCSKLLSSRKDKITISEWHCNFYAIFQAWSTLLRSLHSIFNRTPADLIYEVILVDDKSNLKHLKSKLDDYLEHFPKIKMIRLKTRHGLIRARLEGIKVCQGDILVFLDSHVEVIDGWLEGLINPIISHPHLITCPIIDAIDPESFEYIAVKNKVRGYLPLNYFNFLTFVLFGPLWPLAYIIFDPTDLYPI